MLRLRLLIAYVRGNHARTSVEIVLPAGIELNLHGELGSASGVGGDAQTEGGGGGVGLREVDGDRPVLMAGQDL
jgi:hypothetical protein